MALDPDGSFIYTPDEGYLGADVFWYRASDGHGNSDTAPVNFYIYQPDIDVDSNNDGTIDQENSFAGTDDWLEYDPFLPGKVMGVNDDDDNNNGTPDYLDPGPVAGEDDLVEVELDIQFENGYLKDRVVSISGGKFWDSATKNNEYSWTSQQPAVDVPFDNWWVLGSETVHSSWGRSITISSSLSTSCHD